MRTTSRVGAANADDEDALRTLRRAFHTLKGSGRTVGALALGEFAWAFEHLLNRVLDRTLVPDERLFALLGQTPEALSQIVAHLQGGTPPVIAVEALLEQAQALSHLAAPALEPSAAMPSAAEVFALDRPGEGPTIANSEAHAVELTAAQEVVDRVAPLAESVAEAAALPAGEMEPAMPMPPETAVERGLSEVGTQLPETFAVPAQAEGGDRVLPELQLWSDMPLAEPEPQQRDAAATPAGAPVASQLGIDSDLAEIFFQETGDLLDANESVLRSWAQEPDSLVWREELQRALHTLKGGARTAGVTAMGDLSHALESLLVAVDEGRLSLAMGVFDLLQAGNDTLVAMLETVRAGGMPGAASALLERIDDTLSAPSERPAAIPPAEELQAGPKAERGAAETSLASQEEHERQLRALLLEQGRKLLEASTPLLERWTKEVDSLPLVEELANALRALKRGAKAARAEALDRLAQRLEVLFATISARRIEPSAALVEMVVSAYAKLAELLEAEGSGMVGTGEQALIDNIDQLLGAQRETALRQEPTAAAGPGVADRIGYEQVRVRASLLDSLVDFAAEISIYHSRLQQQVHTFHYAIAEFEQTTARIQEQLRRLSIETEAQILFRHQEMVGQDYSIFDPLELDRYSQVQQLSRGLSESVDDLKNIQNLLDNLTRDSEMLLIQQGRVHTELQEGLMRTRMLPFAVVVPRLRRMLRQLGSELDKQVELVTEGEENELDRTVLDKIVAPMEHLLRNAIDHGFEPASVRQAQGKSATGRVTIRLSKEGTEVVLQVADDGAGIDVAAVRRKALERGLIAESTVLSEQQLLLLILEPGFSTAKRLSQVSGRGVGLDVVDNVVKQLSGTLQVSSHVSRGTTFTIRLPVMLSITQGLVVNTSEEIYAFPLAHIHAVVQLRQEELERLYRVDAPKLIHAGGTYQLLPLAALVERPPGSLAAAPKFPLLLMRFGEIRVALQVDSLIGRREMVVKSLGPILISVKGLLGATILGDGRVALILNAATLVRKAITQAQQMSRDAATPAVVAAGKPITVMVVDDSITIRKVTARLLERHQMQVITAKDGVDALEQLQDQIPDIAILDIEMPRMDGYELARHMRRTAELRHIPIIMITSRIGEKHRQYAKEIGVDRYLGKPYQESELLGNIHDLLQPRR